LKARRLAYGFGVCVLQGYHALYQCTLRVKQTSDGHVLSQFLSKCNCVSNTKRYVLSI